MTNFKSDDEQELLRDGERIRVPLLMMDALQRDVHNHFQMRTLDAAVHRPGYRFPPRATKDELAAANRDWQQPGAVELLVTDAGAYVAREAIIDSYEAYDRELCERYRSPAAPAGETDGGVKAGDHDPAASVADAREQAYLEYDRRTADAWRGDHMFEANGTSELSAGATPFAGSLDARIAAALSDENSTSAALAKLIREAENAVDAADRGC